MTRLRQHDHLHLTLAICLVPVLALFGCATEQSQSSRQLLQYGGMHETIGQQQHHARVDLDELDRLPHFYGVGAVEGLQGEITIADSKPIVTAVTPDGRLRDDPPSNVKAAMLIGQSAPEWTHVELTRDIPHDRFDDAIAEAASSHAVDIAQPFMFVIEGEFKDVRLHVINGACPLHARMRQIELRPEARPFELDAETLRGTIVGVYAADSVGNLTHPDTSVHAHLIYTDQDTGIQVTGHVERIGIAPGATLKLPTDAGAGASTSSR